MLRIVDAVHISDTGRQREANEDSYFARSPVFAVADGMGGAQAGEVASQVAVDAFTEPPAEGMPPEEFLRGIAERANREIFELAQSDTSRSGMGTTLTAAFVHGDEISFGHVGDSRAYVYRDGKLSQITNDHSLVEELRRQGRLTRDQAAEHPQRSVITRALGPEPEVEVDTMTYRARPSDVFLLCSDGLTTMLSDDDLLAELDRRDDLSAIARRLVRGANERGGRDNITVVLFRVVDSEDERAPDGATLVGPTAAAEGLTAEAVRGETSEQPSAAGTRRRRSGREEPPPKRRSRRRIAAKALLGLVVLAVLVAGAAFGISRVWFLGSNDEGQVALYQGLPYELPLGIELYSEDLASPVTLEALPEERRAVVTDHELRSRDDAISLIDDLELAAEDLAAEQGAAGAGRAGARSGGDGAGGGAGG